MRLRRTLNQSSARQGRSVDLLPRQPMSGLDPQPEPSGRVGRLDQCLVERIIACAHPSEGDMAIVRVRARDFEAARLKVVGTRLHAATRRTYRSGPLPQGIMAKPYSREFHAAMCGSLGSCYDPPLSGEASSEESALRWLRVCRLGGVNSVAGRFKNGANEPNGNLGDLLSGGRPRKPQVNEANEPNGSLGNLYRGNQPLSYPRENEANEPNGNLGKIAPRKSEYHACRPASESVPTRSNGNEANEPNGNLGCSGRIWRMLESCRLGDLVGTLLREASDYRRWDDRGVLGSMISSCDAIAGMDKRTQRQFGWNGLFLLITKTGALVPKVRVRLARSAAGLSCMHGANRGLVRCLRRAGRRASGPRGRRKNRPSPEIRRTIHWNVHPRRADVP
jgi:hypothetical protein